MKNYFNSKYPDVSDLKRKAKCRIPQFAFDYLEGGCNAEIGLQHNLNEIKRVKFNSQLLNPFEKSQLETKIFGQSFRLPFGVAPIGLQGLMWPKAPEILAKAALELNIPFILSTVSSASLESIAEISEGQAWFQLYNPTDDTIRKDLLKRIQAARYPVLVVTVDVPTFGYRHRDIRNGLSMPPKMTINNIRQMLSCPSWLWQTILAGKPEMQTLKPYMPKNLPADQLASFMNKTVMGRVDFEALKPLREQWNGPLVLKGLTHVDDVAAAVELGADGVVISNHGGRQLDIGVAPISVLPEISKKHASNIKIFMDSGLRNGPDIATALASGADLTFLGRPFLYGLGALGEKGAYHLINSLEQQLQQVMTQLRCATSDDLASRLVSAN
ncbi:alpha-hydroxy-acid oxidizing protein [Parashewanella spongiae]|uniref:Alpha-hydroxy-acid oxidizing protein n=1 Tax=Parashewanella spongiae TaxID=342950 RepID=A0A3A6TZ69_9GAMM|nr:alpha-hydroxy acid oxidase [Parashewanella spongiae]MCL1077940.1 alpha-hydroxy-acid oxidizing protein [Parashewanella spongiae]RJY18440.1 alpha-hydroxy-acid oxidizing protein [Parashewanella spongiae]